jgi:predicted transcriptional regulator
MINFNYLKQISLSNLTGEQVKILLFIIALSKGNQSVNIDYKELSETLDILDSNIMRSLRILVQKKIIEKNEKVITFNLNYLVKQKPKILISASGKKYLEGNLFD